MFGIDDIISEGLKIVDKFVPDSAAKEAAAAEFRLAMLQAQATIDAAQSATNTAEAANPNLFVSGARPAVMWICAAAFAWQFVAQPIMVFVIAQTGHLMPIPAFDSGSLVTVLLGMLGLGGMHMYENLQSAKG